MLKKNDEIELNIDALTSEGSAVGRYDGMAVFVRGAVPGDTVLAHIIKVSKRYAVAIIASIIHKSGSRIEPDCSVSDKCGGCSFRNMTYEEELRFKQTRVSDAMSRIAHLDIPIRDIVAADSIDRYRNKAQYPVRLENGRLYAGFYAYKSHRIVSCGDCRLHPVEFTECIRAFSDWAITAGITSYDEQTGRGLLRHIYLRKAFSTGEIMACAVINGEVLPQQELLVDLLMNVDGVTSVCFNVNRDDGNVVLGKNTVVISGKDSITDVLLGKKFVISPNSFYQVNHDQCEKLYAIAAEYAALTGKETVVDLYCGAGTIGLTMADKAKYVYGAEIVPQAIENAKKNAAVNGITNASFLCGDAFEIAQKFKNDGIHPDVVILDPPRKGCSDKLIDTVVTMAPDRIVYLSCDSATLARDLALFDSRDYKALEITPVDMFPRTPHVETIVLIQKKNS